MEAITMSKKMTSEEKQQRLEDRRAARKLEAEQSRIQAEKSQRPVKFLTITIEWKKSRMWGNNPHAEAQVEYWPIAGQDHFDRRGGFTCGGCGYNKESTVIAEIFNHYMKYKLWSLNINREKNNNGGNIFEIHKNKIPYGISCHFENNPYFAGGVGESCYRDICEFVGGKWEKIASGSTFDVYQYTDNEPAAEVSHDEKTTC